MNKIFVDTNILVYAHSIHAGAKHAFAKQAIRSLWESGNGILSTQVLQELCVTLQHRSTPALSTDEVRQVLRDYLLWEVVPNTPPMVVQAYEIQLRHRISFWDAMILLAAEIAGASILYSEDFSAGHKYGSIQVVNPLQK